MLRVTLNTWGGIKSTRRKGWECKCRSGGICESVISAYGEAMGNVVVAVVLRG